MLRRILPLMEPEAHPVPEEVLRIAEGLFLWKSVAADLAVLETDDLTTLAGVRGSGASAGLSCTIPGEANEIEIEYFGPERLLIVDLGDARMETVRLSRLDTGERTARDITVEPDEAGVCRFAGVAPGTVFLVFQRAQSGISKTEPLVLA